MMYLRWAVTHALTIIQGVDSAMYSGVSYNEQDNIVPAFMTTGTLYRTWTRMHVEHGIVYISNNTNIKLKFNHTRTKDKIWSSKINRKLTSDF